MRSRILPVVLLYVSTHIWLGVGSSNQFDSLASSIDNFDSTVENAEFTSLTNVESEECYNVFPKLKGDTLDYVFSEHIVISSAEWEDTSRCVILKNIPFSGFYKFYVLAGYTANDSPHQTQEEYQLLVDSGSSHNQIPIIEDKHDGPIVGEKYARIWNDHSFQFLVKGDNLIRFGKGNQKEDPGRINSVDFFAVRIISPPHIKEEPKITPNTWNSIEWIPIIAGAVTQEVFYFDITASALVESVNSSSQIAEQDSIYQKAYFGNLEDGHTFGYYVEAYTEEGKIFRSDTVFSTQDASPPSIVNLETVRLSSYANQKVELVWPAAKDTVSTVTSYIIYRSEDNGFQTKIDSIATIAAIESCQGCDFGICSDTTCYRYIDILTDAAKKEFKYRIDAVDKVGNKSTGTYSKLVVNIPPPNIGVRPARVDSKYYRGSTVRVYSMISDTLLSKVSHIIRFQIARDDLRFFQKNEPDNTYFFEADSLPILENTTEVETNFDLTDNASHTLNFVEGHIYYLRAQLEDEQGNLSAWSDTFKVIPDCFPPSDISALDVRPTRNQENTMGWMDISWSGAKDFTSGIKEYIIYRKIQNVDDDFVAIDSVNYPSYQDSFKSIEYNANVIYKIGSIDRVGNIRPDSLTNFKATVRSQAAPIRKLISVPQESAIVDSDSSIMYTNNDRAIVKCNLYRPVLPRDFILMAKIVYDDSTEYIELEEDDSLPPLYYEIDLNYGQGKYGIKIHALFSDKSTSVWSDSSTVYYDESFQPEQQHVMSSVNVDNEVNDFNVRSYPNPFNLTTTIQYSLKSTAHVIVEIYNVNGRRIKVLTNETMGQGRHTAVWNATDEVGRMVSTGIYYYRINIEDKHDGTRLTKLDKMLLVK